MGQYSETLLEDKFKEESAKAAKAASQLMRSAESAVSAEIAAEVVNPLDTLVAEVLGGVWPSSGAVGTGGKETLRHSR